MTFAIIGRTEYLYNVAMDLIRLGHQLALVVTSKEVDEYRRTAKDFMLLADKYSVPFFQTSRIDTIQAELQRIPRIQIGISINYSGIISSEIINLFDIGILNAHGGDLPRYRGNACQAWAIINGEERIGLCIHQMVGGELDSGDIVSREYLTINNSVSIGEVYNWMQTAVPRLMIEAVEKKEIDPSYVLEKQSKNPDDALRCYPRLPIDGLISWRMKNIEILRLVNASSEPYSGAFTFLNEKKMIIWRAELVNEHENFLATPGQVCRVVDEGFIEVATGDGKIRIKEIEIDEFRGRPSEIIKSIRTRLGLAR